MKRATTCPTGKPGYTDEREAERALGRVRAKRQRYGDRQGSRRGLRIENRQYRCPCGLIHLTSMSRREQQAVTPLALVA